MFFTRALIFGMLILQSFAFGQDATDIQTLNLLGPGVIDRETGNGISIACTDNTCTNYRFIEFKAQDRTIEWVGEPMIAPHAQDPKILRKAQQLTIEQYLDYHSINLDQKLDRHASVTFWLSAIGISVLALTMPESPSTWAIGAAFGVSAIYIMSCNKIMSAFSGSATISKKGTEHSGWNWSINAKKIRHSHFASLSRQVRSGARPLDHDTFELWDRYQKQQRKLTRKGASFSLQKYE